MYDDKERAVFPYYNGQKKVWGDPVTIYEQLAAAMGGDVDGLLDRGDGQVNLPPEMTKEQREAAVAASQADARGRIRSAVRDAFGMVPWNPDAAEAKDVGATAADCDNALNALWGFFAEQKKRDDATPESLPPSAASDAA